MVLTGHYMVSRYDGPKISYRYISLHYCAMIFGLSHIFENFASSRNHFTSLKWTTSAKMRKDRNAHRERKCGCHFYTGISKIGVYPPNKPFHGPFSDIFSCLQLATCSAVASQNCCMPPEFNALSPLGLFNNKRILTSIMYREFVMPLYLISFESCSWSKLNERIS